MRPVDLAIVSTDPDHLKDQLLFYNTRLATVLWIRDLIARNGSHCIRTTKGGLSFPPELRAMILNEAEATALRRPKFSFAKVQSITSLPNNSDSKTNADKSTDPKNVDTKVIRYVAHKFELPHAPNPMIYPSLNNKTCLASNLYNPASCGDFERFLSCATAEMAAKINAQEIEDEDWEECEMEGFWLEDSVVTHKSATKIPPLLKLPGQTFDVTLRPGSNPDASGLYYDLTVPDVIAWVDRGRCWVCRGERFLCPGGGCPGFARLLWDFQSVGCGYRVVCPLCIGDDIFDDHMSYIRAESLDLGDSKWEQAVEDSIKERMKTLGYKYTPCL
ncbi:hypothetical protein B0T21DRAFT_352871 [Apiosordaria backusii]|uniref:Uncharacterized protein n=1 Tax=Apiosordaria backusii TaxID=314023 RepID=A0AA40A3Z3_9PEZI|nr:hypothetical protein B0T21DRAFT_352871 [Apiosordaria backusii]